MTDIYQSGLFVQFQLIPPLTGLKATVKKMKVIIILSFLFHRNLGLIVELIWQLSAEARTLDCLLGSTVGEHVQTFSQKQWKVSF